ncbi:hypothetical protein M0R45_011908 [Rubus argutus]|uniref:Uncharacterized protein n=1 Tax=Rubus argutus TaxID=59490 RepID=A0AAW1YCN7_RUBAR
MEEYLWFTTTVAFFFILFVSNFITQKYRASNPRKILPPSPPSIPIIGHLHLLRNKKEPLHRTFHKLSQKYGHVLFLRLGFRNLLGHIRTCCCRGMLYKERRRFCKPPALPRWQTSKLQLQITYMGTLRTDGDWAKVELRHRLKKLSFNVHDGDDDSREEVGGFSRGGEEDDGVDEEMDRFFQSLIDKHRRMRSDEVALRGSQHWCPQTDPPNRPPQLPEAQEPAWLWDLGSVLKSWAISRTYMALEMKK